jgi:GT2 family glycosyltransferase
LENTNYSNFEIVLIDNASRELETQYMIDYFLSKSKIISSVKVNELFNYSKINNIGASNSNGEYILLLNNDTLAFRNDWLFEMVQHLEDETVGAVGPMLLYDNNTIQHAGVVLGLGGLVGHLGVEKEYNSTDWFGRLILEHDVSAITGAALLTRRSVFNEVAGLEEKFPVAYNDIDYCLKLRQKRYRIIYNPYSILYHFESKSRGDDKKGENYVRFRNDKYKFLKKWENYLKDDPFYSPNLTLLSGQMQLKIPNESFLINKSLEEIKNPYLDLLNF